VDLPSWAPPRTKVADYVPHRTLVRSTASVVASQDVYRLDWDDTTTPTADTVDRLIADGAAWVTVRASPLNTSMHGAASTVAAILAAASIERGWPQDESSLQRANDLEKRATLLLTDLIAANRDANDQAAGVGAYGADIVPLYSFPPAPVHGDWLL
jgi:hypothetical protein